MGAASVLASVLVVVSPMSIFFGTYVARSRNVFLSGCSPRAHLGFMEPKVTNWGKSSLMKVWCLSQGVLAIFSTAFSVMLMRLPNSLDRRMARLLKKNQQG